MNNPRPFRAIPIGKKHFVYGWYFRLGPEGNKSHYILQEKNACWYNPTMTSHDEESITGFIEVIPSTVGQRVGLQDKNKKEIYCGDKIRQLVTKTPKDMYEDFVVIYDIASFKLQNQDGTVKFLEWPACVCLEIISNIHTEEQA